MLLASLACSLDHEKSFFLQDGDSNVNSIAFYEGAMLLTSSSDIIQRDMVTGATQRTFRAHTKVIYSFIVHENSTMITSGWDDMTVVWDLATGSILKRISLRISDAVIESLIVKNDLLIGGCNGYKVNLCA
jgi:WD40 repeat protein